MGYIVWHNVGWDDQVYECKDWEEVERQYRELSSYETDIRVAESIMVEFRDGRLTRLPTPPASDGSGSGAAPTADGQ